jgi:hypothetical protein
MGECVRNLLMGVHHVLPTLGPLLIESPKHCLDEMMRQPLSLLIISMW